MQGWKLQDWIETDEFTGVKNVVWIQVIPHLHDEAGSTSLLLRERRKEGRGGLL